MVLAILHFPNNRSVTTPYESFLLHEQTGQRTYKVHTLHPSTQPACCYSQHTGGIHKALMSCQQSTANVIDSQQSLPLVYIQLPSKLPCSTRFTDAWSRVQKLHPLTGLADSSSLPSPRRIGNIQPCLPSILSEKPSSPRRKTPSQYHHHPVPEQPSPPPQMPRTSTHLPPAHLQPPTPTTAITTAIPQVRMAAGETPQTPPRVI